MSDGDPAPLAADDNGNLLVAFHQAGEDAEPRDAALPASLVALWTDDGRLLLVFDRRRQRWELPGGMIDAGETPRQAAIRELREESGYQVDDLIFEVGCGTGQATRGLAALGCPVTAVEPGAGLAALARRRSPPSATLSSRRRRSRTGMTVVGASTFSWPRRHGTGSTRRSAGGARTRCSIPEGGWRWPATSSSAGADSRRCTPRPPTSTNGCPPGTPTGGFRRWRAMSGGQWGASDQRCRTETSATRRTPLPAAQ
ncbi:hypothetical protein FAIPA1_50097 [Frankia sp. AiPs1]|uniref:NUDIX domain-containing protein n=1 Tax=Frankia sp. AiPa1 TaxID=573492 RepID=UPI002551D508|nr:NUDIX domain-containing protein [Frankia sp. AiPa1]